MAELPSVNPENSPIDGASPEAIERPLPTLAGLVWRYRHYTSTGWPLAADLAIASCTAAVCAISSGVNR
jgi:hypothetical protein